MPLRKDTPPNPERQLMIKTKACERLLKEVSFYKNEVKENEEKLAEMKAANEDPYDIKKFEEVLAESYMMVPDSTRRLKQALVELSVYLESSETPEVKKTSEWCPKATELLAQQRDQYMQSEGAVEKTNLDDLKEGEAF